MSPRMGLASVGHHGGFRGRAPQPGLGQGQGITWILLPAAVKQAVPFQGPILRGPMRLDLSQSNWGSIPSGDARVNISEFITSGHVLQTIENKYTVEHPCVLQLALEAEMGEERVEGGERDAEGVIQDRQTKPQCVRAPILPM